MVEKLTIVALYLPMVSLAVIIDVRERERERLTLFYRSKIHDIFISEHVYNISVEKRRNKLVKISHVHLNTYSSKQ